MRQQAAAHMQSSIFGAACTGGDGLVGIEKPLRVEGMFDRKEHIPLAGRELHAHRVDFFDAHAVLACDCSAEFDSRLENICPEFLGAQPFSAVVAIEQDQRVHVAVARMEYVDAT